MRAGLGRLLTEEQRAFIAFIRANRVAFGDATRGLPLRDSSCEVVYASHVIEHLGCRGVRQFLSEALRILAPGGVLRLAVPDLQLIIDTYNRDGDADKFVATLNFLPSCEAGGVRGFLQAFSRRRTLHRWAFNEASLMALLAESGFERAMKLPAGQTTISDCGELNLRERAWESLYMEALKPLVPSVASERLIR